MTWPGVPIAEIINAAIFGAIVWQGRTVRELLLQITRHEVRIEHLEKAQPLRG